MNLYQKLHSIQSKVNGLGKDKQSNTYSYVTGSKVLEYIKPLMNEYGLILKQEVLSIDNERMDYTVKGKRWEEVNGQNKQIEYDKPKSEILSKVMMKFTWIDSESGDKDENLFGANGQNDWEKGLGSALTYGERYFLLKFFHIATDEDDIDNPERKEVEKETPKPKSEPKTNEVKVTNWMDETKYKEALSDKDKAFKALDFYDGKTDRKGKIYGMKKEYRNELLKIK
ncbi:ERF family protein [Chryseobacterium sp.]|uniref:ERF family protein n=1 Tax=Chryseobacterium sp. TaxID=1871047 RepID=UPI00321A8F4B